MDPFSAAASALSTAGLLGQSCLFISNLLRDISDAPADIEHHQAALEALNAGLRRIDLLRSENKSVIELTPEFSALLCAWLKDFEIAEAKLRVVCKKVAKGRGTRTWTKMKWSLSLDHWLASFLRRVQGYHSIFTTELMVILMFVAAFPGSFSY